jgi:K+-sensing histidine kinase KdpD
MNARLHVLFVSNPDRFLTKAESLHVETCERLCKEFGGEFFRVESPDLREAILTSPRPKGSGISLRFQAISAIIPGSNNSH